jgi:hypothetical protein
MLESTVEVDFQASAAGGPNYNMLSSIFDFE